jgi:cation diffusion facilitator CzcD-associated flavoprotein CzcO
LGRESLRARREQNPEERLMSVTTKHVLIVGTGFAGLGMGIRLKQAGFHDFTIVEQAASIGGTWRDNHYPGAACDIPSHLYSFSFEPNPGWSRSFSAQEEILAYMNRCADKYGLRPHIELNTEISRAEWDERAGVWDVRTKDGRTFRAQALVSGCGGLSRPSYPDIPGLSSFEGKKFHSSRWDHSYPLEGKKVGLIGTGASAIQIVPAIAPKVSQLAVFQRTPPWIIPKPDVAIPSAVKATFRLAPPLQALARTAIYWILESRASAFVMNPKRLTRAEPDALKYLASRVKDPVLRAKLTPNYTMGCKRILLSNEYFEALQRENVALVTDAIDRVTPAGVRTADGQEHRFDALVCATGFQAAEAVAPFQVRGRGGRELNDEWKDDAQAYLGTTVAGYPNLFLIVGPNTGLGHNSMVFIIESQVEYILSALQTMKAKSLQYVDVKPAVQRAYNARLHERMAKTVWSTGGCKAWYTTRDGKNTTLWPGFTFEYRLRTRRFDPASYDLVTKGHVASHARNGIAKTELAPTRAPMTPAE